MGAREELWQMYPEGVVGDVKRARSSARSSSAATPAHLIDVANLRAERRVSAAAPFSTSGRWGRTSTGEALVGQSTRRRRTYDVKRSVINGLFVAEQTPNRSLPSPAKETDPALKREMVSKLSLMTKSEGRHGLLDGDSCNK
jgi:hypothetical protein